MALKIAAATSRTEIAPTRRAALVEPGKSSRVMPMKERSSAQIARIPPQTWNAFTDGEVTEERSPSVGRASTGGLDEERSPSVGRASTAGLDEERGPSVGRASTAGLDEERGPSVGRASTAGLFTEESQRA